MLTFKRQRFFVYMFILGFALVSAGCGADNPLDDSNTDEHHLEAFGVQVYDGTDLLVEADGTDVTGSFAVTVGDTTDWLSILFLGEDGEWYDPEEKLAEEENGEEEVHEVSLAITTSDDEIVVVAGDHESGTEWQFRVVGVSAGEAALRVTTLHGDHEDYVSPEFAVTVTE